MTRRPDLTRPTQCSNCTVAAHRLCRGKHETKVCGCATCYPAATVQRDVKGMFTDLAVTMYYSRGSHTSTMNDVETEILRAVREQFRHEDITVWSKAVAVTRVIIAQGEKDYWSLDEFLTDLAALGIAEDVLTRPYTPITR